MQIMNTQFETSKKYDKFIDKMLRKHWFFIYSANFDKGFSTGKPVEKPVESVNNFLNIPTILALWKRNE